MLPFMGRLVFLYSLAAREKERERERESERERDTGYPSAPVSLTREYRALTAGTNSASDA